MSTGEPTPSEPSGHRPPGEHGAQGQPYQAPGQPYPPPGEHYQGQGYQAPAGGYQAPGPGYPGQPYPGYGAGGYSGPGSANGAPLTPQEERTWAMAAHLSSILGVWIFYLGAVGPLVVMLTHGPRSPYVRAQSVEALNFNISVLIYSIVGWVMVFTVILLPIGFLLLGVLFVAQIVLTIIAAVKTSNGEPYRYPFTIRLVS